MGEISGPHVLAGGQPEGRAAAGICPSTGRGARGVATKASEEDLTGVIGKTPSDAATGPCRHYVPIPGGCYTMARCPAIDPGASYRVTLWNKANKSARVSPLWIVNLI